nr:hypothetical protein [uncultured Rhodopila sp.]
MEDPRFCRKGEGGAFVQNGALGLNGQLPVNTRGDLLSRVHVSEMNHIVELACQFCGEADGEVSGAEIGLMTGYGDMCDGTLAITQGGA